MEPETQTLVPIRSKKPSDVVGSNEHHRRMSMPMLSHSPSILPAPRKRTQSDVDALPQSRYFKDLLPIRHIEHSTLKRYCHSSQIGSVLGRSKDHNQDAYFTVTNFTPGAKMTILGVCDGHGVNGHYVSSFLARHLPNEIQSCIGRTAESWPGAMEEGFRRTENKLNRQEFDMMCSGSTCVTVVVGSNVLVCGNVGDSRAVLGKRHGASYTAVDLSTDHKPTLPFEHQRVLSFGGRIQAVEVDGESIGPQRVWLKHVQAPGLAMTRAFGDQLGARVGVISTPETVVTPLSPEDAFVILASDGVWEFITSQEAVDMVAKKLGRLQEACQDIVTEATRRWKEEEDCVDDITVVIAELENCV